MTELINTKKIKQADHKERAIEEILKNPNTEQKIEAMAATLKETFSLQTKLLVDIRPGATILDTHANVHYIYEGSYPPFDFDPLTTVIFRKAQFPLEDLQDQAYVNIRVKGINGQTYVLAMQDFVKMFATKKWRVLDLMISDERELTKNTF